MNYHLLWVNVMLQTFTWYGVGIQYVFEFLKLKKNFVIGK